ncbi:unnamed protein product, partial [Coregonus sp. 'balchen']
MSSQECTQCAAGTYSLGSGIRFDDWETIPTGFSSLATYLDNGPHGNDSLTCNSSSWFPQSSYLESNRDECTVSLIYAVHLKKQGSVSFDYQYTDHKLFFDFFVNLKSGTNILYWKTAGVLGAKVMKPVLLKNVHIEGVAYASECFPCKPGTFSQTPGSSSCHPCPRDTHSGHGASSCTPCNTTTHYAPTGSGVCKARPPCSKKDYFQIHTPCDLEGKTQVIYRWVEPQICLVGVAGAETLPPSGDRETCPPCNPGFYNNNTATCSPCAPGTFSDGVKACESCPAGTEPAVGYQFKWWNIVPANMKTSCFNVGNSKCDGMNGWEVAGDHIRSGAGGSDNDYLILNLHVPGFKPPMSVTGGAGTEFGRIIFEFEMVCSSDCELYFMMDINRKSTTVVESWEGSKVKQSYTYIMTKNASNVNDMVRIYSISVSNAVDGASSECQACALLSQPSGSLCVPCPPGHYIHTHTSQCTECPPNTHLTSHSTQSPEACKKCGPSSKSNKEHSRCYSDCVFSYSENKVSLSFDYSSLGSRETGESANAVESFICQSTIIPSSGRGFRTALSSQSISLADTFLVKARPDLFPQTTNKVRDVNFFYRSLEATSSCEAGRNVVVTLRCNSERSTQGELTVPSQCPAGTCDGCIFHFLWESSGACPQWVSLPENKTWPCNSMDFLVKMGAAIGAFTAALLFSITCYFWKKNKRLEYKYSKLVMSSNKESELPGADSCAVMEGEVEDEVVYSKKTSLIRKLKAITSRGNRERYENVQLNSSQSNGLVWGGLRIHTEPVLSYLGSDKCTSKVSQDESEGRLLWVTEKDGETKAGKKWDEGKKTRRPVSESI